MSVVALGLRYQDSAMAPPNWCGTPAESSISWSETILGTRLPNCSVAAQRAVLVVNRAAPAERAARKRARGGNRSGSRARGGRKAETWATRPRRSMRASPGSRSRAEPAPGGRVSSAAAIRREDSTNRCISGRRWRWVGAAGARRTGPDRVGIEGPGGPPAGRGQHLVGEPRETGQGAGPRTLGGVDRLPYLETPLGAGDHVGHTHYVTHYLGPVCHSRRAGQAGIEECPRSSGAEWGMPPRATSAGWPPWKPLLEGPS